MLARRMLRVGLGGSLTARRRRTSPPFLAVLVSATLVALGAGCGAGPEPAETAPASSPVATSPPATTSAPTSPVTTAAAPAVLSTGAGPVRLPAAVTVAPGTRWSWTLPAGYEVVGSGADPERVYLAIAAAPTREENGSLIGPAPGRVVALNRPTGEVAWSKEVGLYPGYGPILAVYPGGVVVVEGEALYRTFLVRHDPATGEPEVLAEQDAGYGVVQMLDDQILFTYGYNGATSMLVEPDGSVRWDGVDGSVTGWGATTVTLGGLHYPWTIVDRRTGETRMEGSGEAFQAGDRVFSVNRMEGASRLDPGTGPRTLSRRDPDTGALAWVEPLFTGDEIEFVAATADGDVIVAPWWGVSGPSPQRSFDAAAIDGTTGYVQWLVTAESCATTAVVGVVDELLLLSCDDQLQVREVGNGEIVRAVDHCCASAPEDNGTHQPFALAAGPVVYTVAGAAVLATDLARAGAPLWTTDLPDGFRTRASQPAAVAVDAGLLLVGSAGPADSAAEVWFLGP